MSLKILRRLTPPWAKRWYHRGLSTLAMWWAGRPSRHLVIIGVTGTDGKTTTATMIAHLLATAGWLVGLSTTADTWVGDERRPNESHMTMPGRFALQRLLRRMVKAGCQYAVIEVSSEGLAQSRHRGIDFDAAVMTNISPEHLEAHGGWENYRRSKELLFNQIIRGGDKRINGTAVKKFTVVNLDDPNAERFLKFWAEEHHGVTLKAAPEVPLKVKDKITVWRAEQIVKVEPGSRFTVDGHDLTVPLPGQPNIYNALEALAVAQALGLGWPALTAGLGSFPGVPGRYEKIHAPNGPDIIIDYAVTPAAMEKLFQTIRESGAKRIIAVFGATGGGRDKWKRPELGRVAGRDATTIILTVEDPYDEDPAAIAGAIAAGIPAASRAEVLTILDRRAAIAKALEIAQPNDVIALTGMGSETSMVVKGKNVPWNDARTVQELLKPRES